MSTPEPIRAALERLVELNEFCTADQWHAAIAAARAALEAAQPDGPSLEEVEDLCEEHCFNVEDYESVECLQGLLNDAISRWGRPAAAPAQAADLPPDYIDEWITDPRDRSLLEVFHKACNSEGGSADEVILRGLKAVLQDDKSRSYRLQQENRRFREPERTILCDILANGTLLPDPDGTRYGIPPTPAAGEAGELVAYLKFLREEIRSLGDIEEVGVRTWGLDNLTRAAALLEQLSAAPPAPQPVPVSERLPGPEDCDAEGRCWLFSKVENEWRLINAADPGVPRLKYCFSHWLPAHALPLPTTTPAGQEGAADAEGGLLPREAFADRAMCEGRENWLAGPRGVITLPGAAAAPVAPPTPAAGEVVKALAARPLLEQVAAIGDRISEQTVGRVRGLADRASAWLAENPPGQPVAIEPRGCPTPGACSCVEPPAPAEGEVGELVEELNQIAGSLNEDGFFHSCDQLWRAAALLEQLSAQAQAPQPVAVSERLPGTGDCDAEGQVWVSYEPSEWRDTTYWELMTMDNAMKWAPVAFWLPAHALPLPTTTPAGQEGADG